MRTAATIGLAVLLAGCGGPRQLSVDHAWVRLAAVRSNPAAAYFQIHGGPAAATLIAVSADVAIKAEMHESMSAGGMSSMRPLASVVVPADTTVTFAPGGRHVMLFDVNPGLKQGYPITLTFTFANGRRIVRDATVVKAGDPAPE